jgi:Arc/MetJ family transcription regulator
MRTTVTLDDALIAEARFLTGIEETALLLKTALATLIRVESGRRLILLGGSQPDAQDIPRRRSDPAPEMEEEHEHRLASIES